MSFRILKDSLEYDMTLHLMHPSKLSRNCFVFFVFKGSCRILKNPLEYDITSHIMYPSKGKTELYGTNFKVGILTSFL